MAINEKSPNLACADLRRGNIKSRPGEGVPLSPLENFGVLHSPSKLLIENIPWTLPLFKKKYAI